MNIAALKKPKHGEQRNQRMEVETKDTQVFEFPDGTTQAFNMDSKTCVSERFCSKCDKWKTVKGLFFFRPFMPQMQKRMGQGARFRVTR